MLSRSKLYLSALLIISITACGNQDKLSFDTVESARKQANDNSLFNAQAFRQQHKEFADLSITQRGDSTQSEECGQGDGWASIDLYDPQTGRKVALKCSTVSSAIGCMTEGDFRQRKYADQENKCSQEIPFPIPKIAK